MIWSAKILDPYNIKTDNKSYKNTLIYYIGYVTQNTIKSLHLIINKTNGYIEEHVRNKYLTQVHTDVSKNVLKMYEGLRKKIKDLIRSMHNISDDYEKKNMWKSNSGHMKIYLCRQHQNCIT